MLRVIMGFFGYAKVPSGVVMLSIHQERGLATLLCAAKQDVLQIENVEGCEYWKKRKEEEALHVKRLIEGQQELTGYLKSCRKLTA